MPVDYFVPYFCLSSGDRTDFLPLFRIILGLNSASSLHYFRPELCLFSALF